MGWRNVLISRPSRLRLKHAALQVEQEDGVVSIPLEDIAVLLIENPQVTLSARLLSSCAESGIVVITVGEDHHPNGIFQPYLPHSRALKVMRAQMAMTKPARKQFWKQIVQQKVLNQADVLAQAGVGQASRRLRAIAGKIRSGDTGNMEAQASQVYFPALFGRGFTRSQSCFYNHALNYGYAIVRAALARSLVAYGFLPAFGLHHHNEQNAFNLADDLIEPFRPVVDAHVRENYPQEAVGELTSGCKSKLLEVLHRDVPLVGHDDDQGASTLLTAADAAVMSLGRAVQGGQKGLCLPALA